MTAVVADSNFKQPRLYFEFVIASHRVSPSASPMTGSAKQSIEQHKHAIIFYLSSPGSTGRSSTPRLLDSITAVSGILDHPLSRVMTAEC
jgi:hypothetical protein